MSVKLVLHEFFDINSSWVWRADMPNRFEKTVTLASSDGKLIAIARDGRGFCLLSDSATVA